MDSLRMEIGDSHLDRNSAEKHVFALAEALSISTPERQALSQDVQLANNEKTFRIHFEEEIQNTMTMGKAKTLQYWFDSQDMFLKPSIEVAVFSRVPGLSMNVTATVGGDPKSIRNYGVLESPGDSLADDIRFFHRETCSSFNEREPAAFTRNYRAFLHSCVSIVDFYLHRYVAYVKTRIDQTSDFDNVAILDSRKPIKDRLGAWMITFAHNEHGNFNSWPERSHFIDLKNQRNRFTHPSEPAVSYEPHLVKNCLNFGSSGVGALLARMRRAAGSSDRIGFINQIATLPQVQLTKRR
jgi:hypothetical protein